MPQLSLAPGVTLVATSRRDNAFLVDGDDGLTLVDTGWASSPRALLAAIAELGRSPRDVKRLVLTHAHPDHVQGAAELRSRTGAQVLVHADDRGWLEAGRVRDESGRGGGVRLMERVPQLHWTPLVPDATLSHGQLIENAGGLRVAHTPGHTPGHISLVHEPSGTLLTGDAVVHAGPAWSAVRSRLVPALPVRRFRPGRPRSSPEEAPRTDELALGPATLATDPSLRQESLKRLPANPKAVGFAHGAPLRGEAAELFGRWVTSLLGQATRG